MLKTLRLPLAACAALAVGLGACDFTPTLGIETPEHEARAVVRAVLAADSVATVRVGVTQDPYERRRRYGGPPLTPEATVTLLRDGQRVETLALRSQPCYSDGFTIGDGTEAEPSECGAYVGQTPVVAGATYTVRVEIDGLPTAEGTTTVPLRPTVEVEEEPSTGGGSRRFRIRLHDEVGHGERYGVSLLRSVTYPTYVCDSTSCRDTVVVDRYTHPFETSDPVLLAAAREVTGIDGASFIAFTDRTFNGQTFTFEIEEAVGYGSWEGPDALVVQLAALSAEAYEAYHVSGSPFEGENPLAEPANFPSNVEGGYGLVGSVALAEAVFARGDGTLGARPAGR